MNLDFQADSINQIKKTFEASDLGFRKMVSLGSDIQFWRQQKKGFVAHSHPDLQVLCASNILLSSW